MRATSLLLLAACAEASVDEDGRFAVSTYAVRGTDDARERALDLRVYAPTAAEPAPVPLAALELSEPTRRDELAAMVQAAPEGCPTQTLSLAADAPALDRRWPLVVLSHCHECLGLSGASVARRLATHGFVAVTVDHADNTLWNKLEGDGAALGEDFLDTREADVAWVLDHALDGGLGLAIDAERLGVLGHSFGGATAGRMAQDDPRVAAALSMAAPLANPLMPGVEPEAIDVPVGLLLAVEDNSITELGNDFMREDFAAVAGPAALIELEDAGHWSVSDLLGVHEDFLPGCGEDERQTTGEAFTYLDPATGRAAAMDFATAFFRWHLDGDGTADAWLAAHSERR